MSGFDISFVCFFFALKTCIEVKIINLKLSERSNICLHSLK